jgi:hypothetical protein
MEELKPVAWMYAEQNGKRHTLPVRQIYVPEGWTETPLYTRASDKDELVAELVGALEAIVANSDALEANGSYRVPRVNALYLRARAALAKAQPTETK